jgi:UDP-N-acetylmuramoylalanine--D-glutamate ligase
MNAPSHPAPFAVIVGLGRTGLSAARYLLANGWRIAVTDSRAEPPELASVQALAARYGDLRMSLGRFEPGLLDGASCVIVSPGVAPADPASAPFFAAAQARGLEVIGDVELFARAARAPVVGITGTNGKSTVTTLVGRMAERAGLEVRVGGNLGRPALDLLAPTEPELYVLELSSFQLDSTSSLTLKAATVLNVTPDHLDRYATLEDYAASKSRIFARCDTAVINLDDPLVMNMAGPGARRVGFALRARIGADFALIDRGAAAGTGGGNGAADASRWWLARRGEPLLPLAAMKIAGLHNAANALAALALGEAVGLPMAAMLEELAAFPGLPHRSQWVADVAGIRYVDDSKGTNVGATLAAVSGLPATLVMIAGGEGKGQDFSPLAAAFRGKVRHTVLIGRDGPAIARALEGVCSVEFCASLEEAVVAAARAARPGDTVLLSPACASLDMFRDYAHRGAVFAAAVHGLAA